MKIDKFTVFSLVWLTMSVVAIIIVACTIPFPQVMTVLAILISSSVILYFVIVVVWHFVRKRCYNNI